MLKLRIVADFELENRTYKTNDIIDEVEIPAGSRNWAHKFGFVVAATPTEIEHVETQR